MESQACPARPSRHRPRRHPSRSVRLRRLRRLGLGNGNGSESGSDGANAPCQGGLCSPKPLRLLRARRAPAQRQQPRRRRHAAASAPCARESAACAPASGPCAAASGRALAPSPVTARAHEAPSRARHAPGCAASPARAPSPGPARGPSLWPPWRTTAWGRAPCCARGPRRRAPARAPEAAPLQCHAATLRRSRKARQVRHQKLQSICWSNPRHSQGRTRAQSIAQLPVACPAEARCTCCACLLLRSALDASCDRPNVPLSSRPPLRRSLRAASSRRRRMFSRSSIAAHAARSARAALSALQVRPACASRESPPLGRCRSRGAPARARRAAARRAGSMADEEMLGMEDDESELAITQARALHLLRRSPACLPRARG